MITSEFPPSSGIGNYVYNISKKFIERGHEITVITRGSPSKNEKEVVDEIEVFRASIFPLYPFHTWIHGVFVNRLLKSIESRFALVHVHSPLIPVIETSLPIITTVHTAYRIDTRHHDIVTLYSLFERAQSIFLYPSELKLLKNSEKITTVSGSVARELRGYGFDPNTITVVGNGVDERTFFPIRNRKSEEAYVLYTGRIGLRKGLFDLVECAGYVCKRHPKVKFLVTGKGESFFFNRLKEKVRKTGFQDKIIFLGYVEKDKLVQLYQNALVHVVPSLYEGLPTVLLEAMSSGLPVVATAVSGNTEVISSNVNGFLVPPKAPEEMAKVIIRLLDDANLREKIGREARKTIEKHYTWDKIADNIVKCYESVLGQSDSD